MSDQPTIVIGSYLEPGLAARIAAAPAGLDPAGMAGHAPRLRRVQATSGY